jgi:hypothetical protein
VLQGARFHAIMCSAEAFHLAWGRRQTLGAVIPEIHCRAYEVAPPKLYLRAHEVAPLEVHAELAMSRCQSSVSSSRGHPRQPQPAEQFQETGRREEAMTAELSWLGLG